MSLPTKHFSPLRKGRFRRTQNDSPESNGSSNGRSKLQSVQTAEETASTSHHQSQLKIEEPIEETCVEGDLDENEVAIDLEKVMKLVANKSEQEKSIPYHKSTLRTYSRRNNRPLVLESFALPDRPIVPIVVGGIDCNSSEDQLSEIKVETTIGEIGSNNDESNTKQLNSSGESSIENYDMSNLRSPVKEKPNAWVKNLDDKATLSETNECEQPLMHSTAIGEDVIMLGSSEDTEAENNGVKRTKKKKRKVKRLSRRRSAKLPKPHDLKALKQMKITHMITWKHNHGKSFNLRSRGPDSSRETDDASVNEEKKTETKELISGDESNSKEVIGDKRITRSARKETRTIPKESSEHRLHKTPKSIEHPSNESAQEAKVYSLSSGTSLEFVDNDEETENTEESVKFSELDADIVSGVSVVSSTPVNRRLTRSGLNNVPNGSRETSESNKTNLLYLHLTNKDDASSEKSENMGKRLTRNIIKKSQTDVEGSNEKTTGKIDVNKEIENTQITRRLTRNRTDISSQSSLQSEEHVVIGPTKNPKEEIKASDSNELLKGKINKSKVEHATSVKITDAVNEKRLTRSTIRGTESSMSNTISAIDNEEEKSSDEHKTNSAVEKHADNNEGKMTQRSKLYRSVSQSERQNRNVSRNKITKSQERNCSNPEQKESSSEGHSNVADQSEKHKEVSTKITEPDEKISNKIRNPIINLVNCLDYPHTVEENKSAKKGKTRKDIVTSKNTTKRYEIDLKSSEPSNVNESSEDVSEPDIGKDLKSPVDESGTETIESETDDKNRKNKRVRRRHKNTKSDHKTVGTCNEDESNNESIQNQPVSESICQISECSERSIDNDSPEHNKELNKKVELTKEPVIKNEGRKNKPKNKEAAFKSEIGTTKSTLQQTTIKDSSPSDFQCVDISETTEEVSVDSLHIFNNDNENLTDKTQSKDIECQNCSDTEKSNTESIKMVGDVESIGRRTRSRVQSSQSVLKSNKTDVTAPMETGVEEQQRLSVNNSEISCQSNKKLEQSQKVLDEIGQVNDTEKVLITPTTSSSGDNDIRNDIIPENKSLKKVQNLNEELYESDSDNSNNNDIQAQTGTKIESSAPEHIPTTQDVKSELSANTNIPFIRKTRNNGLDSSGRRKSLSKIEKLFTLPSRQASESVPASVCTETTKSNDANDLQINPVQENVKIDDNLDNESDVILDKLDYIQLSSQCIGDEEYEFSSGIVKKLNQNNQTETVVISNDGGNSATKSNDEKCTQVPSKTPQTDELLYGFDISTEEQSVETRQSVSFTEFVEASELKTTSINNMFDNKTSDSREMDISEEIKIETGSEETDVVGGDEVFSNPSNADDIQYVDGNEQLDGGYLIAPKDDVVWVLSEEPADEIEPSSIGSDKDEEQFVKLEDGTTEEYNSESNNFEEESPDLETNDGMAETSKLVQIITLEDGTTQICSTEPEYDNGFEDVNVFIDEDEHYEAEDDPLGSDEPEVFQDDPVVQENVADEEHVLDNSCDEPNWITEKPKSEVNSRFTILENIIIPNTINCFNYSATEAKTTIPSNDVEDNTTPVDDIQEISDEDVDQSMPIEAVDCCNYDELNQIDVAGEVTIDDTENREETSNESEASSGEVRYLLALKTSESSELTLISDLAYTKQQLTHLKLVEEDPLSSEDTNQYRLGFGSDVDSQEITPQINATHRSRKRRASRRGRSCGTDEELESKIVVKESTRSKNGKRKFIEVEKSCVNSPEEGITKRRGEVDFVDLGNITDDVEFIKRSLIDTDQQAKAFVPSNMQTRRKSRKESPSKAEIKIESTSPVAAEENSELVEIKVEPEVEIKAEYITDLPSIKEAEGMTFQDGELVYGKLGNYPFWPALVMKDPSTNTIRRRKVIKRKLLWMYHIRFFADDGKRCWVSSNSLIRFCDKNDIAAEVRRLTKEGLLKATAVHRVKDYIKSKWEEGVSEAMSLVNSSIEDRYTFFEDVIPIKSLMKQDEAIRVKQEFDDSAEIKLEPFQTFKEDSYPLTNVKVEDTKNNSSHLDCVSSSGSDTDSIKIKIEKNDDIILDEYYQKALYKRNNLFRGVPRDKVCHICLKLGKTEMCKGRCGGYYHTACVRDKYKPSKIVKKKLKYEIPTITLDEDSDFRSLPLEEQMTIKMKEIMAPICNQTTKYGSESSSEESTASSGRLGTPFKIIHVAGDDIVVEPECVKPSDSKEFVCYNCLHDVLPECFACGEYVSISGSDVRLKCSVSRCRKFYHAKCLKIWPQTQHSLVPRLLADHTGEFTCPMHICHTCICDDPRAPNAREASHKLVKCLKCPATYHCNSFCVPAGTEIHSISQIICPRHIDTSSMKDKKKYATINTTWCFICSEGGNLVCCETCPTSVHPDCSSINLMDDGTFICEDCETGRLPLYDEVVWVKLGSYRWWPGIILYPNDIPHNVRDIPHAPGEFVVKFFGTNDHYWVGRYKVFLFQEGDKGHPNNGKKRVDLVFNQAVETAAEAYTFKKGFKDLRITMIEKERKPPHYIKLKVNKPVGNVKLFDGNVSHTTPCNCSKASPHPCSSDSDCLNRLLLTECDPDVCPAGNKCENQSFEKRLYPPLVPNVARGRGWGLKTLAPIRKGEFVIEYVGEVIDDQEYQRRLKQMHEQKETNFYFLTIDNQRMIDAGPKGNLARFMNHSCEPNCETQKWTVKGDTRVGLFARVDIPKDSEVNFNYNLECVGEDKKECMCGTKSCTGFIGAKSRIVTDDKKTRKYGTKGRKKRSTTPTPPQEPCFVCGKLENVYPCYNKACTKYYHMECIDLDIKPDSKWSCPRHYCYICSKRTRRSCVKCIRSYCHEHSEGQIRHDGSQGFICTDHDKQNPANKEQPSRPLNTSTDLEMTTTTSGDDCDSSWSADVPNKRRRRSRLSFSNLNIIKKIKLEDNVEKSDEDT